MIELSSKSTGQQPKPTALQTTGSIVPSPQSKPWLSIVIGAACVLTLLVITAYACHAYGYRVGYDAQPKTGPQASAATNIQVPDGTTIIEQCAPERGTQYILPQDIPHGPVYGVYQGKVVGLEYMIGKAELASNVSFYNLPLYDKIYNHLDIGLQSDGHAGFPLPHYHVDIHTDSRAASAAITCS
jgi:hypothetical protein